MGAQFRPLAKSSRPRGYSAVEATIIELSGSLKKPGTRAERRTAERTAKKRVR